jgi:hypothetical protein
VNYFPIEEFFMEKEYKQDVFFFLSHPLFNIDVEVLSRMLLKRCDLGLIK